MPGWRFFSSASSSRKSKLFLVLLLEGESSRFRQERKKRACSLILFLNKLFLILQ